MIALDISGETVTATIAVVALLLTVYQLLDHLRSERIRLLLGDKEAVAHAAMSIAMSSRPRASRQVVQALVGAALFEGSDRARLVVYAALKRLTESKRSKTKAAVDGALKFFRDSRDTFEKAVDPGSFDKRLRQLSSAPPDLVDAVPKPPHVELRPADDVAPDGMKVWPLARGLHGSMAKFQLGREKVGSAVRHRTVDELWNCLTGESEMWLRHPDGREDLVHLTPGTSVAIAVNTTFQLRNVGHEDANFVGVTIPPWPGKDEADVVAGLWTPS